MDSIAEAIEKVQLRIKVTAPEGAPAGEEEKVAGEIIKLAEVIAEIQGAPKPEVSISGGIPEGMKIPDSVITVGKADYFEALQEQKLSRCPYHKPRMDTVDWCKLDEVVCKVEQGDYDCEEWRQIQAEWIKEDRSEKPYPSYRLVKDKLNGGE